MLNKLSNVSTKGQDTDLCIKQLFESIDAMHYNNIKKREPVLKLDY